MPGDSPDHILKQGLAALKTADYANAIGHFAQLLRERTGPAPIRLKAHIGLIKALKGDGQTAAAIALCQKLVNHPQPKVKQWASETLATLTPPASAATSQEAIATSDLSGFRPLASADLPTPAIAPPPAKLPQPSPEVVNPTGFRPLDAVPETLPRVEPEPTNLPATDTSFLEAEGMPDASETAAPLDSAVIAESPSGPQPSYLQSPQQSAADPPSETGTTASLFHYEELNQQPITSEQSVPESAVTFTREAMAAEPSPPVLAFQTGERLDRPRKLPLPSGLLWQAWMGQVIGAIALFWLCRSLLRFNLAVLAGFLTPFSRILPIPLDWRYQDGNGVVLGILVILLIASPWLLDRLLQTTAGLKALSIQQLQTTHPEGCRLLRRISQKRGWLMPLLQELPTSAPLIFSYGWLPRYSRIVVSRGLLEQLTDDELATLVGYEMAHVVSRTSPFMSLVAVLLQLCHQGYWQVAQWGNRHADSFNRTVAAIISSTFYGLYWLFRKVNVLAARSRVLVSDRQTVVWTGNPNALMRALVKLETGIAQSIIQTGYTPPLVESTDLLTPIGYEAAIGLGSLFPDAGFLGAIAWDMHNPYRRWLSLNSSHPGLGARLKRLTGYAGQWQLTPALPLPEFTHIRKAGRPNFGTQGGAFWTQIGPYLGPVLGVSTAMLLWFLGGVFEPLGLQRIGWLYGDRSVLWGSLLLGLGMGIMIRINAYFPDITAGNRFKNPPLSSLYKDPLLLPTVSQPARLTGKLLGRPGIANWLCQDLIIQTSTGLLKLHFFSALGPFGNLLTHPRHPSEWVGQSIDVQGWYRRGAIAWMDIEAFFQNGKLAIKANHPLWSVCLCLSCCALGLLILIRG
ncbi:MAG: M48 family metalloprotease [Leptolyngbya sp. SIOISBB]|nr:M48 family metalloprotease [Leptolyngbya sp. SIOISBB]